MTLIKSNACYRCYLTAEPCPSGLLERNNFVMFCLDLPAVVQGRSLEEVTQEMMDLIATNLEVAADAIREGDIKFAYNRLTCDGWNWFDRLVNFFRRPNQVIKMELTYDPNDAKIHGPRTKVVKLSCYYEIKKTLNGKPYTLLMCPSYGLQVKADTLEEAEDQMRKAVYEQLDHALEEVLKGHPIKAKSLLKPKRIGFGHRKLRFVPLEILL